MTYFNYSINMIEQEMGRIWIDQYRSFADTILVELQHNYYLRLRTIPSQQPNPKVVKRAQNHKKEVDKSTME